MAQQGFTVTSAKAANGESVHINGKHLSQRNQLTPDHVYVSPPWSMRDGTSQLLGIANMKAPHTLLLECSSSSHQVELTGRV